MAYANISDIEARWRVLSTDEAARANALLEDAATILDGLADTEKIEPNLLCQVSCNMVIRAMSTQDLFGASSSTITAGAYSQTVSYAVPSGDLYLTKTERRLLGVSTGYIGTIPAKVDGYYD